MGSRQDRDYEDIQVTFGIKKDKFLVELELFPPNQTGGKETLSSNFFLLFDKDRLWLFYEILRHIINWQIAGI